MARKYDAIVIGSGLGGLTAGALFARHGQRVLVLERNINFGGCATTYRRGQLMIEASLHQLDGLDADDPKVHILQALGLLDSGHFVTHDVFYEVRSAVLGEPFELPFGIDAALAATSDRFPRHRAALREYFDKLRALRLAFSQLRHGHEKLFEFLRAPALPPPLATLQTDRYATLGAVLTRLFGDDEAVKIALYANMAYYGGDADDLAFLACGGTQASYLAGRGYFVRGGSQALSDALVKIIRDAGGAAEINRTVTEILLDDSGRAIGVAHEHTKTLDKADSDRREDFAPVLFGNAAPPVLAEALPAERREAFMAPFAGRPISTSVFSLTLGFDRNLTELGVRHYSTILHPDWMKSLRDFRFNTPLMGGPPGDHAPSLLFINYGAIDSGLASKAPCMAVAASVDLLENWSHLSPEDYRDHRDRWAERIIAELDRAYPGLKGAVVAYQMSTALSMQNWLNTPQGAVYGFHPVLPERLPETSPGAATAVEGLWLASTFALWGGYTGAILGGAMAARQALEHVRGRA